MLASMGKDVLILIVIPVPSMIISDMLIVGAFPTAKLRETPFRRKMFAAQFWIKHGKIKPLSCQMLMLVC